MLTARSPTRSPTHPPATKNPKNLQQQQQQQQQNNNKTTTKLQQKTLFLQQNNIKMESGKFFDAFLTSFGLVWPLKQAPRCAFFNFFGKIFEFFKIIFSKTSFFLTF
jgi:hypothetical protein